MHSLIGLIVYATSRTEALRLANERLEFMCGEDGQPFDWGFTMDKPGARWGIKPVVMTAHGQRGQRFLRRLMGYTEKAFRYSLGLLRKQVEKYNDDELYEQRHGNDIDLAGFRYRARATGVYCGGEVHLYDNDCEGIHGQAHLDDALDRWERLGGMRKVDEYAGLTVYVVPADVSY